MSYTSSIKEDNYVIIINNEEDECVVCLDCDINDEIINHCNNKFHRKCLQNWVIICKKEFPLICPICSSENCNIPEKLIFPNGYSNNNNDNNNNNNCFSEIKKIVIIIYSLGVFISLIYLGTIIGK